MKISLIEVRTYTQGGSTYSQYGNILASIECNSIPVDSFKLEYARLREDFIKAFPKYMESNDLSYPFLFKEEYPKIALLFKDVDETYQAVSKYVNIGQDVYQDSWGYGVTAEYHGEEVYIEMNGTLYPLEGFRDVLKAVIASGDTPFTLEYRYNDSWADGDPNEISWSLDLSGLFEGLDKDTLTSFHRRFTHRHTGRISDKINRELINHLLNLLP